MSTSPHITCPACGAVNQAQNTACSVCGQPFLVSPQGASSPETAYQQAPGYSIPTSPPERVAGTPQSADDSSLADYHQKPGYAPSTIPRLPLATQPRPKKPMCAFWALGSLLLVVVVVIVVVAYAVTAASTPTTTSPSPPVQSQPQSSASTPTPTPGQSPTPCQINRGISTSPVVVSGVVYIITGTYEGPLYALDAASGRIKWSSQNLTAENFATTPVVVNGVVYAGTQDGTVYALNAASGRVKWSSPNLKEYFATTLVVVNGGGHRLT